LRHFLFIRLAAIYYEITRRASETLTMKTFIAVIFLSLFSAGCSRWSPIAPSPQVMIAQNGHAKYCPINTGDTVTTALQKVPTQSAPPTTVVLVRRGPEGIIHERLDCGWGLQLLDLRKDQCLRDGDQLIMPVAVGPAGLSRPHAPGIPVSE
jgi:hypothetical protein